jgi:hypothetical protein
MADTTANLVAIYALTHPLTGEIRYVGKTNGRISRRLSAHINSSANRITPVACWIRSLLTQGLRPSIIVLEYVPTTKWEEKECEYIASFRAQPGCRLLNVTAGGDVGNSGWVPDAAYRANQSRLSRGRRHTMETLAKMSVVATERMAKRKEIGLPGCNKGSTFSAQARANLSAAHRGKVPTFVWTSEMRDKVSKAQRGIPWSDAERAAVMDARERSTYKATEEHRRNLSEAAKADWARRKAQP